MSINYDNITYIGGPIGVSDNVPMDIRTVINTTEEFKEILNAYVGLIFFVKDISKFYYVTSLKDGYTVYDTGDTVYDRPGPIEDEYITYEPVQNHFIGTYSEFASNQNIQTDNQITEIAAGQSIGVFTVVYLSDDGMVYPATIIDKNHADKIFGVTISISNSPGDIIKVVTSGKCYNPNWYFGGVKPGQTMFVGREGQMVAQPDQGNDVKFMQQIGILVKDVENGDTIVEIDIEEAIILVE